MKGNIDKTILYLTIILIIASLGISVFLLNIDHQKLAPRAVDGVVNLTVIATESGGGGTGGGGGGGGGGGSSGAPSFPGRASFEIDGDVIKVVLIPGESLAEYFKIKNKISSPLDINIDLNNLKDFMKLEDDKTTITFKLDGNQEQLINLFFKAPLDIEPGVYPGEIIVKGDSSEIRIKVIIEVETPEVLFDVSLDIPAMSRIVFPGENLILQVTLFKLIPLDKVVDVYIEYSVKDLNRNIIVKEEETISIDEQESFIKSIKIPEDTEFGDYVAAVKVSYKDSVGVSSKLFEVASKRRIEVPFNYYIILIILVLIILLGVVVNLIHQRHIIKDIGIIHKPQKPKITKEIEQQYKKELIEKTKQVKNKGDLRRKLDLLAKSYKLGYISKESYIESKNRIKNILKK